jgi:hypothetical protein
MDILTVTCANSSTKHSALRTWTYPTAAPNIQPSVPEHIQHTKQFAVKYFLYLQATRRVMWIQTHRYNTQKQCARLITAVCPSNITNYKLDPRNQLEQSDNPHTFGLFSALLTARCFEFRCNDRHTLMWEWFLDERYFLLMMAVSNRNRLRNLMI